jgi:hypothetical protein
MNEKVETDASVAIFARLYKDDVTDETILKYLHHPEYALRMSAARNVVSKGRSHLVLPLLQSSDPRLRDAGLATLIGKTKSDIIAGVTPEMYELAGKMVADPSESWWVKISAAKALANANPKVIARYIDPLMTMLEAGNWWLSAAACKPLSVLATTPEHYQRVQPVLLKTIFGAEAGAGVSAIYGYLKQMGGASPEVKAFAAEWMMETYPAIPREYPERVSRTEQRHRHQRQSPAHQKDPGLRHGQAAGVQELHQEPAQDDPGGPAERQEGGHVCL